MGCGLQHSLPCSTVYWSVVKIIIPLFIHIRKTCFETRNIDLFGIYSGHFSSKWKLLSYPPVLITLDQRDISFWCWSERIWSICYQFVKFECPFGLDMWSRFILSTVLNIILFCPVGYDWIQSECQWRHSG